MVYWRLLLTLVLALAIPIQGLAGTTCRCQLSQAQTQAPGEATLARTRALPHMSIHANAELVPGGRAPSASAHPKKHGHCANCAISCCKATASGPTLLVFDDAFAHGGPTVVRSGQYASWAEPVPDKPPRS